MGKLVEYEPGKFRVELYCTKCKKQVKQLFAGKYCPDCLKE
jgi:hypothetical protein